MDSSTVKLGLTVGFGLLGLLFGGLYPKNKPVAIAVLSPVPITLVTLFLIKYQGGPGPWLHQQGFGGLVSIILVFVMLGVALFVAAFLDDEKKGGKSWFFHGVRRLRQKFSKHKADDKVS